MVVVGGWCGQWRVLLGGGLPLSAPQVPAGDNLVPGLFRSNNRARAPPAFEPTPQKRVPGRTADRGTHPREFYSATQDPVRAKGTRLRLPALGLLALGFC
jgi:hypothetical protein